MLKKLNNYNIITTTSTLNFTLIKEQFANNNLQVCNLPIQKIEYIADTNIKHDRHQIIIITSPNSAFWLVKSSIIKTAKILCSGAKIAKICNLHGFTNTQIGTGGMSGLIDKINIKEQKYLFLRGKKIKQELASFIDLEKKYLPNIKEIIVYKTTMIPNIETSILTKITGANKNLFIILSLETCLQFWQLIKKNINNFNRTQEWVFLTFSQECSEFCCQQVTKLPLNQRILVSSLTFKEMTYDKIITHIKLL